MLRQCAFVRSVLYAAGRFRRGGLCRLRRGRVGLGDGSKAAFGQVCDVQQVFERVLRPQCLDGLALSFSVCFLAEGFLTPLGRRPLRAYSTVLQ